MTALDALVDDVVWAYPLLAVGRTLRRNPPSSDGGPLLRARLSTAADRGVVAPNNDTFYGSGFYDLRDGELSVAVPAMEPHRYWSVMLLDAYTNVSYVCRRLHGSHGVAARVRYDPSTPPTREGPTTRLPLSTPTVWVLVRVLVDGPDDADAATAALESIRIEGPTHPDAGRRRTASDPLAEISELLGQNAPAPWHPPPPPGLAARLVDGAAAGLGPAVMHRAEARLSRLGHDRRANGWGTRLSGADFGHDVAERAACAKFALAAHLPAECRSYLTAADGSEALQLRFAPDELPPVGAFWSLTMYGPDAFLVHNPLDRHSIGDRTIGLEREPDGSLVIDIGADPPPRRSNWLPAPPGRCTLALRAYEGGPEIITADWFPPPLFPRRVNG